MDVAYATPWTVKDSIVQCPTGTASKPAEMAWNALSWLLGSGAVAILFAVCVFG